MNFMRLDLLVISVGSSTEDISEESDVWSMEDISEESDVSSMEDISDDARL